MAISMYNSDVQNEHGSNRRNLISTHAYLGLQVHLGT